MHEHTISSVTHKERNGFVHLVCFRSLGVGDEQIYFLSHLVQSGCRLTATEDHFVRRQREHRIDAACIVASALDEVERSVLYLCRVRVAQRGGLAHDASVLVFQDDSPGVLVNLDGSVGAGVDNAPVCFNSFPVRVSARFLCQHDRSRGFRLYRSGEHTDAYGTRGYEVDLELQTGVVYIGGRREIEHSQLARLRAVRIESLAGDQMPAFPVHQSFA